jgi:hypothetical protein
MASGAPQTPVDVVRQLSALTGELRGHVDQLALAERDMVEKRHAADMAEARAFLNADGAMDMRRMRAKVAAGDKELEALVAESLVRVLKARIKATEIRIDVGRTYGATLRAELSTLGYDPAP